ncbi:MAG: hypothetical protein PVH15_12110 [Syntrophobacterales bacterium]|jgi:hypothetical protein
MFGEALQLDLDLAIEKDRFQISGDSIKNFKVSLYSYGFEAKADFSISSDIGEDKLFPKFTRLDPIEARLSIRGVYDLPSPRPEPLIVSGLVTWKSVREVTFEEVEGHPVLLRHYSIHFQDPAQVLWRQHFPTALYERQTMEDVLKAQVVKGVSLQMDWDILEKELPMICLSLGATLHGASFYDFLIWYVTAENGVLTYDSQENTYMLSEKKDSRGQKVSFVPHEVEEVRVHLPETSRHSVKILNSYTEKPRSEEIDQDQAIQGVRQDLLVRTPIASEVDDRQKLETAKLKLREHEVEIVLKEFPRKTFRTGTFVEFDKKNWSKHVFPYNKKYRVCEIKIDGQTKAPETELERDTEIVFYDVEMTARLESRDDLHVHLPPFKAPHYPIFVEGKILSDIGKDRDKTYQIASDKKTSLDFYTVRVPLWNKDIKIPFEPDFFTGHFYFPAYKHTRTLVALYFDCAQIDRFLEWGEDVRLPMDTQGNHILFGKNYESQTSMQHIYVDDKPLLSIERVSGIDTELIKLEEGTLILQTKEDETKKTRKERVDLTPRVESARFKMIAENEAAMVQLRANFQASESEVTGELNRAMTEVRGELDAMDAEITGKVNEIMGRVEAAMRKLAEQADALKSQAEKTKAELKEKIKL